jgi:hypothetical protein
MWLRSVTSRLLGLIQFNGHTCHLSGAQVYSNTALLGSMAHHNVVAIHWSQLVLLGEFQRQRGGLPFPDYANGYKATVW